MAGNVLPDQFRDLEPFVSAWALPTQREREKKRAASTPEELQAFYAAMLPRMDPIIEYLNQFPLEHMRAEARRLFYCTLSIAEIAPFVELYDGQSSVPNSFTETRFVALHGDKPS